MSLFQHKIIFYSLIAIFCMSKGFDFQNKQQNYYGWWVYGDNNNIFKEEKTLEEWELYFPNEDMQELKELYLSLENMQYFPIECKMTGSYRLVNNIPSLFVSDFEILHIQGCDEK